MRGSKHAGQVRASGADHYQNDGKVVESLNRLPACRGALK
jgi:hypothetical protein